MEASHPIRLHRRIQPEDNLGDLPPIGTVCLGIEQTQIDDGMFSIIGRHYGVGRRRVCKTCCFGHERATRVQTLRAVTEKQTASAPPHKLQFIRPDKAIEIITYYRG